MAIQQFPRVNGKFCSYADIKIFAAGRQYVGVAEISYKSTREPGKVKGTSKRVLGRTTGDFEFEGSMTMYDEDAREFQNALGPGFMEQDFSVSVSYEHNPGNLNTDQLMGVCITEVDRSNQEGPDPCKTKYSLHILNILYNGRSPMR